MGRYDYAHSVSMSYEPQPMRPYQPGHPGLPAVNGAPGGDDVVRMMMADQDARANQKESSTALLLWFFLGGLGAHNFYLGRTGVAVAQLILTLSCVGLIVSGPWVLIEVFLIGGLVREVNQRAVAEARQRYGLAPMPFPGFPPAARQH